MRLSPRRLRAAIKVANASGALSRRLGRGSGVALAGRILTLIAPDALSTLSQGVTSVLVSATNGKTTTTAMCSAVLATKYKVATNSLGNNMTGGLAQALASSEAANCAVLEVDEAHLGIAINSLAPKAILLLNLSRDQLDRVSEVRSVASRWSKALSTSLDLKVIANVSDPMIQFAVSRHPNVVRVALGNPWSLDASACPACDAPLDYSSGLSYRCTRCEFHMPSCEFVLNGSYLESGERSTIEIFTPLPGAFNVSNAAMATVLGIEMGIAPDDALRAISAVGAIAGRYETVWLGGRRVLLLMAKNPAGWQATIEMLRNDSRDVVIAINAQVADGKDTSWLYDVDFSPLGQRTVMATGERRWDLSTRLHYDGVAHRTFESTESCIAASNGDEVVFVGNYTAFQSLRRLVSRASAQ